MAPEQATGERKWTAGPTCTRWAPCCTRCWRASRRSPGPTARSIMTRSLTEAPRSLTGARQGLPPAVDASCRRRWPRILPIATRPGVRWSTALDGLRQPAELGHDAGGDAAGHGGAAGEQQGGFGGDGCDAEEAVHGAQPGDGGCRCAGGLGGDGDGQAGRARQDGRSHAAASGKPDCGAAIPEPGRTSDEYFADGIADEVRGKLSRVSGLTVIASSSASQYKGTHQEPAGNRQRARRGLPAHWQGALGTGAEGTRRVQVVPELIDAAPGDAKWQQGFDTDITDVFEVQSQIATRVAGALGVALGGNEQRNCTKRPTENVEAYQLYLKGRAVAERRPASLRARGVVLEQAVALDSTFGDAWAASRRPTEPALLERHRDRRGPAGQGGAGAGRRPRSGCRKTHLAAARYHLLVARNRSLRRRNGPRPAGGSHGRRGAFGRRPIGHGQPATWARRWPSSSGRGRSIPVPYTTLYSLSQVYDYLGRAGGW